MSVIHVLMLENGIVTSDILLHLSLSRQISLSPLMNVAHLHLSLSRSNLAVPLNIGVNHFAFFVVTRVEEETN